MTPTITVTGLRELQTALRQVDKTLPRELAAAHRHVAELILTPAQQRMSSLPVPKAAAAAAGLRARGGQRSAAIAMLGSNRWVRAVEFGTITHHVFGRERLATSMRRRVFAPWAGNQADAGYALFPTIRDVLPTPTFAQAYLDALDRVYVRAYPKGHL